MDTTIIPTATSSWELLAQLAQYAQEVSGPRDAASLAAQLGALLARYLPVPAGCLEVIEDARVVTTARQAAGSRPAVRNSWEIFVFMASVWPGV